MHKDRNGILRTIPDKCERVNSSLPGGSWGWWVAVDALQKTVVVLLVNVCRRRCNDITQKKQIRAESAPKIKIRLQTLDYKDVSISPYNSILFQAYVTDCQGLCMPVATFPEIFNKLFFPRMLWICVQNLKFLALPVPEIIEGTHKNLGSPWIRPRSLFSKIVNGLVFGWTLECSGQILSPSLHPFLR